eukprot:6417641-Alexandrium_andersonii.AAC.1
MRAGLADAASSAVEAAVRGPVRAATDGHGCPPTRSVAEPGRVSEGGARGNRPSVGCTGPAAAASIAAEAS